MDCVAFRFNLYGSMAPANVGGTHDDQGKRFSCQFHHAARTVNMHAVKNKTNNSKSNKAKFNFQPIFINAKRFSF